MASQLKHTVDPDGLHDFTSLDACIDHIVASHPLLTTLDVYADVEISGDWSVADSTVVSITGITTDATRYVNIYTLSACRHDGKYNTSKYRIETSVENYTGWLSVEPSQSFIRVTGLQGYNSYSAGRGIRMGDETSNGCIFDKIISRSSRFAGNQASYSGNTNVIKNSVFISAGDTNNHALDLGGSYSTCNVYNCVAVVLGGTGNGVNVDLTDNNKHVYNTYAHSAGGVGFSSNFTGVQNTLTTCASSDGSQSTLTVAYSTSAGAYFTNVTGGSEDFHIGTSSSLKNAGTDLSATFTDDIDGQTRPTGAGTWDIGADEYVDAAPPLGFFIGVSP